MKLVDNWRAVLLRAYSIWATVFAAVMAVAIQVVPFMSGVPLWVVLVILVLGVVARLIEQPGLHDGD